MERVLACLFLVAGFILVDCKHPENKKQPGKPADSISRETTERIITADTLTALLLKAKEQDTLAFENWTPLLSFQSGYLLNKKEKSAVWIRLLEDNMYTVELFTLRDDNWEKNDSIGGLVANRMHFGAYFKDYNWDNEKDIYIQVHASNGYSLSYGHLLTINPGTKKFTLHQEAFELANMEPDPRTKSVISDEFRECKNTARAVCKWTNRWIRGKLRKISIKCPCTLRRMS